MISPWVHLRNSYHAATGGSGERGTQLIVVLQRTLAKWHSGKNMPVSVGDARDMALISGVERQPGE